MGEEKLDNTVVDDPRALRPRRPGALEGRRRDGRVGRVARAHAREAAFEGAWWMPEVPQHADSLDDPGNVKTQQRHWIGVTPMEVELLKDGEPAPGLTTREHGTAALQLRETDCYTGEFGLFHTGAAGCDGGPAGRGRAAGRSRSTRR